MNHHDLKAYLDLVQQLLDCPRGEEWILLRKNEQLVNPELIEVMEQVAHYLAAEGEINGARYLHNWAGKLHHILSEPVTAAPKTDDKSQAYAELIQTLLNCQQGEENKILQANSALLTPQLVQLMRQVASQFADKGDAVTASFLENLATEVNRTWVKTHDFQPSLEKANQLAPDPWDDNPAPSSPSNDMTPISSTQSTASTAAKQATVSNLAKPQPETVSTLNLGEQIGTLGETLGAIATTLEHLEQSLAIHLQSSNPLEYLAVLEQAAAAAWVISSSEVERLIGVKPHCKKGTSTYERGNWRFIKAGKIGTQTGWRIEKIPNTQ